MRWTSRLSYVATLLGIAVIGAACAGLPGKSEAKQAEDPMIEAFREEQTRKMLSEDDSADPYLKSQVDIEMSGQWISPGILQITIMNNKPQPLTVGPKNFGLVLPPNRTVIPAKAESEKLFPVARLAPGEQASGTLQFPPVRAESEVRLVFAHPKTRPAMARID